jgi:hypothetical protein
VNNFAQDEKLITKDANIQVVLDDEQNPMPIRNLLVLVSLLKPFLKECSLDEACFHIRNYYRCLKKTG